jgi:hypothetical protein
MLMCQAGTKCPGYDDEVMQSWWDETPEVSVDPNWNVGEAIRIHLIGCFGPILVKETT